MKRAVHGKGPSWGAWVPASVVALVLCVGSAARAHCPTPGQATPGPSGVVQGTVLDDDTGAPLPDVAVMATTPALQCARSVLTDSQGRYRLHLSPGIYTVRFERELFKPRALERLQVRVGDSLTKDVELLGEALHELIYIFNRLVETHSTSTELTLTSDFIAQVPVNRPWLGRGAVRSFDRLAELVPGVQLDEVGPSIHGATPWETRYLLDGLSTNDPGSGANALPLSTEFVDDVRVITAGYLPEYGQATGGIIEAEVGKKAYPHQLHASVFGYWVPGRLAARATSDDTLVHLGDFGATLGGPLVKERLSFFAGVAPALGRVRRTGEGSRTFLADQRTVQAVAKLRYRAHRDHQLALSFITTPTFSRGDDSTVLDEPLEDGNPPVSDAVGTRQLDGQALSVQLTHTSSFSTERVWLDTRVGWLRQRVSSDLGAVEQEGNAVHAQDQLQARAWLSYRLKVLGEHHLKAGLDAELLTATLGARSARQVLGGFVQDRWFLPFSATLNAGLRYDAQWLEAGAGPAVRPVAALSPRVGLSVAPGGSLDTRVFAHVAKYQGRVPPQLLTSPGRSVTVEPDLVPPSTREFVMGIDSDWNHVLRTSASYTRLRLDAALLYLPREDGAGVLLGNPGEGLASGTPRAERTYDAVTLAVYRDPHEADWRAHLGYTWARLRGNTPGLLPLPGTPGLAANTAPVSRLDTVGPLPADRTHTLKFHGGRDFYLSRRVTARAGLAWLAASGTPREGGGSKPWGHTVDATLGARYASRRTGAVELSLDLFNVFDSPFQRQVPRQLRLGVRYER